MRHRSSYVTLKPHGVDMGADSVAGAETSQEVAYVPIPQVQLKKERLDNLSQNNKQPNTISLDLKANCFSQLQKTKIDQKLS